MPHKHRPLVPTLYTPWLKNVKKKPLLHHPDPVLSYKMWTPFHAFLCVWIHCAPLCPSSLSPANCTLPTRASPFTPPTIQWLERPFPIMLCLHLTHQTVAVPAARAPAQITTRQLIELFFSSQAGGHCKNIPTLEYGFLVQVRHRGHLGRAVKELSAISVSLCCMQETVLAV